MSEEDKLIPIDEVEQRSGLERSTIYRKIKRKEFPDGVKLSKKAVRWSNNAISNWIAQQVGQPRESM